MTFRKAVQTGVFVTTALALSACNDERAKDGAFYPDRYEPGAVRGDTERDTIWDLFRNIDDPNTSLEVNRYIWLASLDVLSFMPVQRVDPFSGIIVLGYGTPPGGGTSYRATVHVTDPALDARSLKVALATRSGPADPDTVRAVEDAILSRARQLRIKHSTL